MTEEISDEELERRMRRKLFFDGASKRGQSFTDEERQIAAKLLGTSEAQRLQNRRENTRPFKPKKPVVVVEYYEVPPRQFHGACIGGGWRVDVRENGVLRNSKEDLSRKECLKLVADCERRGAQAEAIITEWMKHNAKTQKAPCASGRKSFSDRYGDFDPEVDD